MDKLFRALGDPRIDPRVGPRVWGEQYSTTPAKRWWNRVRRSIFKKFIKPPKIRISVFDIDIDPKTKLKARWTTEQSLCAWAYSTETTMATYKAGDLITFTYSSPTAHDRNPIVLVVTPRWQGKMHGVNLKKLPEREREMLLRVVNPDYHSGTGDYVERMPALQKILEKRRSDPSHMSSKTFYQKFIAGFVRRYNSYRIYTPMYISSVRSLDYDKFRM